MAEFVPINGKLLAFGLTWVTISHPKKEAAERISLARSAQAEYIARYNGRAGREIKYGLAKRVMEKVGEQPKGSILSAALLFSLHVATQSASENSVLIFQIDDKTVAIIALLQGVPYLDLVVKASELDNQLGSLYQEGHAAFVVYSNIAAYAIKNISANELAQANAKLAALTRFTDPIKKAQRVAVAVFVIGVIAGLANWKINKNRLNAESATQSSVDPTPLYKENRQRLLANANFNGEAAFNAMWNVMKNRELVVAGWSLKSIVCTPTRCEEVWKQRHGSFSDLRATVQAPQSITLQPNAEVSTITYPLAGKRTLLADSALPKKDALWLDLVSQQLRMKRIHPGIIFTPKPTEIRGLMPNMIVEKIPADLLLYAGEVQIQAPLGLTADLLQHHLQHITIHEMSIESFNDVRTASVQIKGTYYAQH